MFGLFKKKTKGDKLRAKYEKLMEESFKLSRTNRKASDAKRAKADEVMKQIEALPVE